MQKRSFTRALTALGGLGVALFTGCETTADPAADSSAGASVGREAAAPLSALDAIYQARSAMVSLADGSAANPAEAAATVAGALSVFERFDQRLGRLERSFDSVDYTALWEQLDAMGTIYQFNAQMYSANELRGFETALRPFRNDVADLKRSFGTYLETYRRLIEAVGPEITFASVQAHVPLVNQLTQQSVGLDSDLRNFSENLNNLSRTLKSVR